VVLDIGCGGGATGKLIKEKFPGTRVLGIELNPHAAAHARRTSTKSCAPASTRSIPRSFVGDAHRHVLLLDVLEHLYDPWRALTRIRGWLAEGTAVLASVPNIRNLVNLHELAVGRGNTAPTACSMSRTSGFFTRASLRRLFEETGYAVTHMEPLTQPAGSIGT
jgi:trans-aconitate methyltransferase